MAPDGGGTAVQAYCAKLEHRLGQAKAMNGLKGVMLAGLLEAEASAAGCAELEHEAAAGEVRDALAETEREAEGLRERIRATEAELERTQEGLDAARLRLARETHFARHGDPRVRELASALRAAEGLHERAPAQACGAARRAHARADSRLGDGDLEEIGGEQALVALERACAALRVGRMGCDQLRAALDSDMQRAVDASTPPRDHRARELRPSRRAHAEAQAEAVSLRREIALAAADVEGSERWYCADAAHHARIAAEVDALDRLAAERAGWLARLKLDGRELDELVSRVQGEAAEPAGASDDPLALLRAFAAERPQVRDAAMAAGGRASAQELHARKEALGRVRARSASAQAFLAEVELRTREAESALVVGLGRYAQAAREAHAGCARVQALDELWAQGAFALAEHEARLSEAITDLLARAPAAGQPLGAHGSDGGIRGRWSGLAGEVETRLAEARRALLPSVVHEAPSPDARS